VVYWASTVCRFRRIEYFRAFDNRIEMIEIHTERYLVRVTGGDHSIALLGYRQASHSTCLRLQRRQLPARRK
jgi:hypothetical protein